MKKDRIEAGAKAWDAAMGGRYFDEAVEELSGEVETILNAAHEVITNDEETIESVARLLSIALLPYGAKPWEQRRADEIVVLKLMAKIVISTVLDK